MQIGSIVPRLQARTENSLAVIVDVSSIDCARPNDMLREEKYVLVWSKQMIRCFLAKYNFAFQALLQTCSCVLLILRSKLEL